MKAISMKRWQNILGQKIRKYSETLRCWWLCNIVKNSNILHLSFWFLFCCVVLMWIIGKMLARAKVHYQFAIIPRLLNHKSIKIPFMYLCRVSIGMQLIAMAISTVCNSLNAISCMFFFHFARFLFVFATQSSFLSWQNEKKSVRWRYILLVRHNHEATISIRFDTWNEIFYPSKLFFSTVSRQLSISFSLAFNILWFITFVWAIVISLVFPFIWCTLEARSHCILVERFSICHFILISF